MLIMNSEHAVQCCHLVHLYRTKALGTIPFLCTSRAFIPKYVQLFNFNLFLENTN